MLTKRNNEGEYFHSLESRKRGVLLAVVDAMMITMIYGISLLLRFDFHFNSVEPLFWDNLVVYLPFGVASTLIIFFIFKLYSSIWRYAGVDEAIRIVVACVTAAIVQMLCFLVCDFKFPHSYPVICFILLVGYTVGIRFSYRFFRAVFHHKIYATDEDCIRVMLIGAGTSGELMIKESFTSEFLNHKIVCIIDDDVKKQGSTIHGIKVVGGRDRILDTVQKYKIEEIIIAIPSADYKERRKIYDICKETSCNITIMPGLYQIVNDEVKVSKLRKIQIEDLLGREPITNDNKEIAGYVADKVVVVTGGGGSIGSELCRQIADYGPKQLIVLDNYENNAYDLQMELKRKHPELDLVVRIVNVQTRERVESIFNKYRPEVVFHAAAHKHVPLMEDSPCDAIKNNVFGTMNVARAASEYGVERMVLISTDKAVRPTNIMGASKRICELVIQYFNEKSETEYMAVRFGNVLGSNGSVVPLFRKQIAEGGPVTVTHPDIIRYFMTIPEAVNLVLEAGAYGHGGEIFILDMGEPVKILDLAKNMIRLSGYKPYKEIDIVFTGLRPGEKLYEELLISEKNKIETDNDRIFIAQLPPEDPERFERLIEKIHAIAYAEDREHIREAVKELVPEYKILQ